MGNVLQTWNFKFGPLGSLKQIPVMKPLQACLSLLFLCSLFACDFRRVVVNDPIIPKEVEFIAPGRTTMQQIVDRLGAPDEITGTKGHLLFRYHFKTSKFFRIDFGALLRLWSPVSPPLSWGNGITGTDAFLVAFDSEWIAQDRNFSFSEKTKQVSFWPF